MLLRRWMICLFPYGHASTPRTSLLTSCPTDSWTRSDGSIQPMSTSISTTKTPASFGPCTIPTCANTRPETGPRTRQAPPRISPCLSTASPGKVLSRSPSLRPHTCLMLAVSSFQQPLSGHSTGLLVLAPPLSSLAPASSSPGGTSSSSCRATSPRGVL